MNDKEFGQRVRYLREKLAITREEFCEDELELSVRQLSRIEAGQCKPTFSKIGFIASRLNMGLYELMPDFVQLPERYSRLKYEVLRTPTYGDQFLVEQRNQMLTIIYDKYYDELPEEEKIAIDAFQSTIDVFETRSNQFGKEILDDYFEQVHRKEKYSINDLLIIRLYLEHIRDRDTDATIYHYFSSLVTHLPNQQEVMDSKELFILRDVILISIGILGDREDYEKIPSLFDALDKIMVLTQDFQKKPILNLLKWKYELHVNKNRDAAQSYFEEATLFAKLIGNDYLVHKIKEDWEEDSRL